MRREIIYVGGFVLPEGNAAAHRVLAVGKILRALGYRVDFLGVDKSVPFKSEIKKVEGTVADFNLYAVGYPKTKSNWLQYLVGIGSVKHMVKSKGADNIAAIIAYNYPAIALLRLRFFCWLARIPLIGDCTEWYQNEGGGLFFKLIKKLDTDLRMRFVQPMLNGLICISHYLIRYYSKYKVPVVLLPPLIDMSDTKWSEEGGEKDKQARINLIYAGNPGDAKDRIGMLVDAFASLLPRLVDFHLDIIGITKENFIATYPCQARQVEELGERLKFHGRMEHRAVLGMIKRADYSIFLRRNSKMTRAGFPTKFVESLACGTPVLTTKTSDLASFLLEGYNGYFIDVSSKVTLGNTLCRALSISSKEIAAMKRNCIQDRRFDYRGYVSVFKGFMQESIKMYSYKGEK